MPQRTSAPRHPASPAIFEALEPRKLLSATIERHVILVVATEDDDEISVSLNEADPSKVDVTENGVTTTFSKEGRQRVRIFAGHGDDVIDIGDDLGLKVQVFGQRGDDEIFGGNQRELLVGGHGDDFLSGGPKFDWLMGMQGEDEFDGADESREYADLTTEDGVVIELIDAPQAVQTAVLDLLDGAEMEALIQEDDDGLVFELEWEDLEGVPHSAKIRPNGEVVELETEIDIEELPEAVVNGILARYPTATITEAETLEIPGEPLAYEVEVVVRRTIREIVLTPAGEILDDQIEGHVRT